jgi:uncharacterized iron-regulated protein
LLCGILKTDNILSKGDKVSNEVSNFNRQIQFKGWNMKLVVFFTVLALFSEATYAQIEGILKGADLQSVNLEQSLDSISAGSILIVGENHALPIHQNQQLDILNQLRKNGLKVAVGMEFFTYTDQAVLEDYREGKIFETEFLSCIQWTGFSYDFYRPQALFPLKNEGAHTVALNAPRSLTGKVSKLGLGALTELEIRLLPPDFSLGRESYKNRFFHYMGSHFPSKDAGERYFTAQSIWDDTMAWVATEYIKSHEDQVLVIIVGDFHVQFGGGLPDRIRVRAPNVPVTTFSLINTSGLSLDEIELEIQPTADKEVRADYLWLKSGGSPGH